MTACERDPGGAGRLPHRLRHLVYLDALIVPPGEAPFDNLPKDVVAARRQLAMASSGGLSFPPPPPEALGVQDPEDAAWLARRMTPQPLRVFETRVPPDRVSGESVPRTYVACTSTRYEPFVQIHRKVEKGGGYRMEKLATGHDAMVTAPRWSRTCSSASRGGPSLRPDTARVSAEGRWSRRVGAV